MKDYKPLLSSAPAHSILNAQTFHYTNSAATDIRKTFARVMRSCTTAQAAVKNVGSNVRPLTKKACDTSLQGHSPKSFARSPD